MTETTLREGEQAVDLGPAEDAALRFIGRIRTPFATRADCPRQGREDGPDCALELLPEWSPALDGLAERFDHADILYWLDRSRRDLVRQSPKSDGRVTGTFALRSPVRPNPIGLSRVRIVRREGHMLIVRGLDCIDGTPLLDIKPDACSFSPQAPRKNADEP